ncbi:MAG: ferrous iron transport protein A [Flavobacteriales bacterium]|nr:ferrous iron transport protein A [Flavobacteriales bacterium]
MRNLLHLKPGEKGTIQSIVDRHISLKLMEMGCSSGAEVVMGRAAPFGDPITIMVSGSRISMRKSEAASILLAERATTDSLR